MNAKIGESGISSFTNNFQCTQLIFQRLLHRHRHCRRRCLTVVINRNDCVCGETQKSVNFNLKLPLDFIVAHLFRLPSLFFLIFFLIYNIDVFYCYFMMIVNVQSPTLCFLLVQYIDFEWNWIYIKESWHILCVCVWLIKNRTHLD